MNELAEKIQSEIKKVIIGKDEVIKKVLMAILAQGHVLMEDVPGVGKTTISGMLIEYLCEKKGGPVLAVDADASANQR